MTLKDKLTRRILIKHTELPTYMYSNHRRRREQEPLKKNHLTTYWGRTEYL